MGDDSSHYLLIINNDGNIVNSSEYACKILGYDANELIGMHFTKINPTLPNEFGEITFGSKSVLSEDNYLQLDTAHKTKNGKIIPIIAQLKLYKPNENERYVLVNAKVKKYNDKTVAKDNSPEFMKNSCDFYYEIDKDANAIYLSPSMNKIFGFDTTKIIGKNYFSLLKPDCSVESQKTFDFF